MSFPIEYTIIIVWILIGLFIPNNKGKAKYLVLLPLLIYMIFIALFRAPSVGTDYLTYIDVFKHVNSDNIKSIHDVYRTEMGFLREMIVFKWFSDSYIVFYGIQFLIFALGFWHYCKFKKSDDIWSVLVFFFVGFYFRSFNAIRQFMVIGLAFFCLPWLEKGKYIKYAIPIVLFSLLFHSSELLFLLLIPIHMFKDKRLFTWKIVPFVALVLSFSLFFLNHTFINELQLLGMMGDRFNLYFDSGATREEIGYATAGVYTLYAIIVLLCANLNKYSFEVWTVVLSVIVFNVGSIIHITVARLALDFMLMMCPLISLMIRDKSTKMRLLFAIATLTVSVALFIVQFVINNNSDVKPYLMVF